MGRPVEAGAVKSTDRTLIPGNVAETRHAIVSATTPVGAATPFGATEFHRASLISSLASEE